MLKFWANFPTCFPNIFTVLSPLWILRMQRHAGKQGTCRCIPRSCIFRMLVIVNYELHHTKNRSKLDIARWWSRPIQISKPIWTGILPYKHQSSTKLVLTKSALCWFKQVRKMWVLFCSFCGTFYVHISDSCPPTFTEFRSVMEDSSAKQLPVVPTKNGVFKGKCSRPKFTRNIKTLAQMKTSAHPAGPFLTQLTLVLHSLQFHWRWEAGGIFWEQKKVSWPYFPFSVTKHSTFFVTSFPMQLKTCNNHPKKRGCQDHRWRVVILLCLKY